MNIPSYLKNYEEQFKINPREANNEWFAKAGYGLFIHYGLFSLSIKKYGLSDSSQEWIQYAKKVHVAEYAKLKDEFTAKDFNAKEIVDFAKNAGMKYINITTRHHDSFCIFKTEQTDFNSLNSPAKRDLIKELYDECEKQGMALFLYYSHGRDWRHPHAPNNDQYGGAARPVFDVPEPTYAYGNEHDLNKYVDFMNAQITELLTQYPNVAGIWLDGIATPKSGDWKAFKTQELYDLIHKLSPHALVSYKQGLLGTEDFFAPEHTIPTQNKSTAHLQEYQKGNSAVGKMDEEPNKRIEMCTTMIVDPVSWGYRGDECKHLTVEQVEEKLEQAKTLSYNLLLNIGLTPTGGIDKKDKDVLLQVGKDISC